MIITNEQFRTALQTLASSKVVYPNSDVSMHVLDWFELDIQDGVDFGVLEEPKWHYYSDIRLMEMEWLIEEIMEGPFRNALAQLGITVEERVKTDG